MHGSCDIPFAVMLTSSPISSSILSSSTTVSSLDNNFNRHIAFAQEGGGGDEEGDIGGGSEDNGDSGNPVADGLSITPTETTPTETPDGDCLFDPDLPKCAPGPDGKCPDGFAMNEDGQCFPRGGCPEGYHGVGDDESARCISNTEGCPEGMIFIPSKKSCEYKENVCQKYPEVEECRGTPTPTQNGNRNTVTQIGTIIIQDLTGSITTTPNCAPLERTVSLGPSTMAEEGIRVIATLSPCHLLDGTVLLNLPTNGIQLVVANVVAGQPVNAITVNKQLVANLGNGQELYSMDLNEVMSGTTPNKGTPYTLNNNINTMLLWNDAGRSINLVADNNLALNILSHR